MRSLFCTFLHVGYPFHLVVKGRLIIPRVSEYHTFEPESSTKP